MELEPLSAFDRRMVHNAIKDDPDIETHSVEVEGTDKKAILFPAPAVGFSIVPLVRKKFSFLKRTYELTGSYPNSGGLKRPKCVNFAHGTRTGQRLPERQPPARSTRVPIWKMWQDADAAFLRRDMSRRNKAQTCPRTPKQAVATAFIGFA